MRVKVVRVNPLLSYPQLELDLKGGDFYVIESPTVSEVRRARSTVQAAQDGVDGDVSS